MVRLRDDRLIVRVHHRDRVVVVAQRHHLGRRRERPERDPVLPGRNDLEALGGQRGAAPHLVEERARDPDHGPDRHHRGGPGEPERGTPVARVIRRQRDPREHGPIRERGEDHVPGVREQWLPGPFRDRVDAREPWRQVRGARHVLVELPRVDVVDELPLGLQLHGAHLVEVPGQIVLDLVDRVGPGPRGPVVGRVDPEPGVRPREEVHHGVDLGPGRHHGPAPLQGQRPAVRTVGDLGQERVPVREPNRAPREGGLGDEPVLPGGPGRLEGG